MVIDTKSKNILYLVHSYNTFQKDTVDQMAKYFSKVFVIVRYKPLAELSRIIKINSIKIHQKEFVIQENDKPENVQVFSAPLWYLPFKYFYSLLGDWHFKKTDRIIKQKGLDFDIVHSHFTWTAGYVGMKIKKKYGVPFVLTVHENDSWFNSEYNSGNNKIYDTWRNADTVIRVNKQTIKKLKKYNENTVFISNGYNGDLFFPTNKDDSRKKLNLDTDKNILVSIGHLTKRKGFTYLVKAIDILINEMNKKNVLCLIIGEGPDRLELEKEISNLKLSDYIKLIGSKKHNQIPDYINASDFMVMPSLAEGTPISMFESLGCGKPFIGTSVGGVPDIINSEKYGILCPPKDYESLSYNINKAITKNWDYEAIKNHGKSFTWESTQQEVLNIYKRLLK